MTTFQKLQMKLAGSRSGRAALHLLCLCQDGKLRWHARGILRELPKPSSVASYFSLRLIRQAQAVAHASALAEGMAAIHDTVFLTKPAKSVT
jgi:hypothetical protein